VPVTYTIFADTTDGFISNHRTTATGGGTNVFTNEGYNAVGMDPFDFAQESFLAFDTSSIPDGATITSVTLSLWGEADGSTQDFTIEARLYDWGASLTGADWRSIADLGSLTLLASRSSAGWAVGSYNVFTSEAAFLSNINKTGSTRFLLCSSRHRTNVDPSQNEYVHFEQAEASGTSNDPKLVVEAV